MSSTQDHDEPAGSPVVTVVEAQVDPGRAEDVRDRYHALMAGSPPPGLRSTMLLRGGDRGDRWQVVTVWESRSALERMRSSTDVPAAVGLFRDLGAAPAVSVHELVAELATMG